VLFGIGDPGAKFLRDAFGDFACRQMDDALQQGFWPFFAEIFFGRIQRFGHTIGKSHQDIAGTKLDRGVFLAHLRKQLHDGSARR